MIPDIYFYDPVTGRLDTLNYEQCNSDPVVGNGELHYEQYNAGRKLYMYVLGEKDSVGRITFRRDTVEKETEEGKKLLTDEYMYEYNSRGYLQKIYDAETGTSIFTASYDLNGNRTAVYNPHHKYNGGYPLYDSQDRLVSYGDYRYEYTEHGALSKKRDVNETAFDSSDDLVTTYSYDHGGRLTKVNLPNNDEIRYTSDALNRRIAKMKNGNYEYKLLYSGQLSPIARLNDEDRVVEEYVYGSRVNVPEYMIKDGRKYRFITDHRGSVRMVVDTHTGTVMQRTDYDEFGFIIDEDLAENWTPVLFGYAGGLQDRDTGLIRFGARDYDPMVGRWTSKEPLGFNGSSNFYVYAENDPVNYVDVNGLWIDTFIDVMAIGIDMLNIAQDIYKLITRDPSDCPEDFEDVDLMGNLTSLSLNVLSAMLPGVIAMGHVKDLSKVTHKHHLLPKQFKEFFKKAGLNIEDFKIPISGDKHIMKGGVHPKGWNKDWDKFIKSNDPNPEKILDYMNKMRKKYNI